MSKILLSSPHMGGNELNYIKDAFEKNWIAPLGENVDEFESDVKSYTNNNEALALSSGTAAIHLALIALGVEKGDYVLCSTLTFSGSCNPIIYCGAIPVFIDSENNSWNMSPKALESALTQLSKEGIQPKAVIVVDLYGQSAQYDELLPICARFGVPVIEDAAEALGASFNGKKCGSFGKISILSFNGNKIITTSGGGMLLTNSKEIREKCFKWSTQSREPQAYYEHKELGFNYRMSNICAGIGRGQMEVLEERVRKKREIYDLYKEKLESLDIQMMPQLNNAFSTNWLSAFVFTNKSLNPFELVNFLAEKDIEARPIWKPMHLQPYFEKFQYFQHNEQESVSENIFKTGICLPSDTKMSLDEQNKVILFIREFCEKNA